MGMATLPVETTADTAGKLYVDRGEPDTAPQIIFVAVGKYNEALGKLSLCHWSEAEAIHPRLIRRAMPVVRTWIGKYAAELVIHESIKGFLKPPPKGYKVHTIQNVLPNTIRAIEAHLPLASRSLVVFVQPNELSEMWLHFVKDYPVSLHLYSYPMGAVMRSPTRIRFPNHHVINCTRNIDVSNSRLALQLRAKREQQIR